jgi:hypothetical protein
VDFMLDEGGGKTFRGRRCEEAAYQAARGADYALIPTAEARRRRNARRIKDRIPVRSATPRTRRSRSF